MNFSFTEFLYNKNCTDLFTMRPIIGHIYIVKLLSVDPIKWLKHKTDGCFECV